MRTIETWQNKIQPIRAALIFPARLNKVLQEVGYERKDGAVYFEEGEEKQGLYLYGDAGFGKTILAARLILEKEREMYLKGQSGTCVFIGLVQLLEDLKQTFSKDKRAGDYQCEVDIIKKYRAAPLLVLDDIGMTKPSEWAYNVIYSILNYRYDWLLPTIFTCNKNIKELQTMYGDDRLTSRIDRMCVFIKKKNWK